MLPTADYPLEPDPADLLTVAGTVPERFHTYVPATIRPVTLRVVRELPPDNPGRGVHTTGRQALTDDGALADDANDAADDDDGAADDYTTGELVEFTRQASGPALSISKRLFFQVVAGTGDMTLEHEHTYVKRTSQVWRRGKWGRVVWFNVESCMAVYEYVEAGIWARTAHCMARKLTRVT